MAPMAAILGFGFPRLSDKHLSRLVQFFCGLLVVTGGRFLLMTSAVAYSRWPPWQPSWIWFLSDKCLSRLVIYPPTFFI
jgi:hypothetical protein